MAAERATLVSVHCQLYDYQRDWLRKNAARGDRNAALRAALDDYIQKIDGDGRAKERPEIVRANRVYFLSELRSGKYPKGTTVSDARGRPVVGIDGEGWCAGALMCDLFYDYRGIKSNRNYLLALGITVEQERYIANRLNDTPLTFAEIADRIEAEIFTNGEPDGQE